MLVFSLVSSLYAAPVPVTMALDAPWSVAHQDEDHINLRYGDSAEGVRVQLQPSADWRVGITPIQGGRPYRAQGNPMVEPPLAPVRAEVVAQGPDLVVRLYGPPLSAITTRPDAPSDAVHTWVRLRPRGESWRIVLDGLGRVHLTGTSVRWDGEDWWLDDATPVRTTAANWRSGLVRKDWTLDLTPAVHLADPYPRTAWTWTTASD